MPDNRYFLGGTDVSRVAFARVDEREAISTYPTLIEQVRARCGDEVASLFAEPVIGTNRVSGNPSISWYCGLEGTPFALRQLDAAGRQPVIDLLKQRLRSFSALLVEPHNGAVLGSWLYVLSADSIMAVAGQPVIKNWGMVPADVAGSEDARDNHFRNTLGEYIPAVPTPPFNSMEAQSFGTRIAQLAERETARFAAPPPPPPPQPTPAAAPPPDLVLPSRLPAAPRPAGRPWLAPAIASVVAGGILAVLTLAHLLRYPSSALVSDTAAVEAQEQVNAALRDRLAQLRRGDTAMCVPGPNPQAPAGGSPAAPPQPLLPPLPQQTRVTQGQNTLGSLLDKATVLVLAGDSLGSGFFINDRDILTNHHVVGNETSVRVGNRALGSLLAGKVIATGSGREPGTQDLAVIETAPQTSLQPLQIGVLPQRLDQLTAAGYPGAVLETIKRGADSNLPEANFTQGIATQHQSREPEGIGTILHTAQIGHGNSGGPLVDSGGCVVGVNSWLNLDQDESTVYSAYFQAIDAQELRKFLSAKAIAFTPADQPCRPAAAPTLPPTGSPPLPAAPHSP